MNQEAFVRLRLNWRLNSGIRVLAERFVASLGRRTAAFKYWDAKRPASHSISVN